MKNFLKQNRVLLKHSSILFITILSVYIFFLYLFQFIAPFFIGWLFSLLFTPFVNFLEKKANIPRWIGSFISILLLIGFFAVIVFADSKPFSLRNIECIGNGICNCFIHTYAG